MKKQTAWTYKDVLVLPADRNTSGIRWCANSHTGVWLKSDTKQGMRELITESAK